MSKSNGQLLNALRERRAELRRKAQQSDDYSDVLQCDLPDVERVVPATREDLWFAEQRIDDACSLAGRNSRKLDLVLDVLEGLLESGGRK